MAQIINITSEALQNTIRRLLPSQQGFGEDLQATNVVTPIIDLTPSAEGSEVRQDLQTALAFGSQTTFLENNSNSTLVSTPGFWRCYGYYLLIRQNSTNANVSLSLTDGLTNKQLWEQRVNAGTDEGELAGMFDITVFLRPGDSLTANAADVSSRISGSVRQIADVNGNLINPSGFTPQ
jgi:hypothetical protein